jgi:hypothetical protein
MPTQVQFRRGNTSQNQAFTGANGEITIDVNKKTIIVHDGATPGGYPLAHNTAFDVANAAYTNANSILSLAQAAYDRANSSNDVLYVEAAFNKANAALANVTNTVFQGNLTITGALTVGMNTTVITETSIIAQSFFIGNSTSYVAVSSGTSTNASFDVANASFGHSNITYAAVNSAFDVANSAFANANSTLTLARAAFDRANLSNDLLVIESVYTTTNAAFDKANSANVLAYDTGIGANGYSVTVGLSSNAYANLVGTSGNAYSDVSTTAANNYAGYLANTVYGYVNTSMGIANAAFDKANNALANSSGSVFNGNLIITGNVTVGSSQLNNFLLTTSSTNDQILDVFDASLFNSAQYIISINSGGELETTQISLLHNSSNVFTTEYGTIYSDEILATFSASLVSGNVRLNVVPKYTTTTIKVLRTTI